MSYRPRWRAIARHHGARPSDVRVVSYATRDRRTVPRWIAMMLGAPEPNAARVYWSGVFARSKDIGIVDMPF